MRQVSRAQADLVSLQNQMDVFKSAELRIKSLGIEEYKDNVLLRLAVAIRDGKLDRTMDMHMLVALAHNAPLERNSRQRHFGNELMRFFVYVFGMRSAKAAHRALTARHEGSADAANAPANLINLPSTALALCIASNSAYCSTLQWLSGLRNETMATGG